MSVTFEEYCSNNINCSDCELGEIAINECSTCEKIFMQRHDAKVRAEVIDEFAEMLVADLIPMRDKKFDIAKGTAMPERYTHLKVMDTLDMVIEMVKIRAEQLKEQKNG